MNAVLVPLAVVLLTPVVITAAWNFAKALMQV